MYSAVAFEVLQWPIPLIYTSLIIVMIQNVMFRTNVGSFHNDLVFSHETENVVCLLEFTYFCNIYIKIRNKARIEDSSQLYCLCHQLCLLSLASGRHELMNCPLYILLSLTLISRKINKFISVFHSWTRDHLIWMTLQNKWENN